MGTVLQNRPGTPPNRQPAEGDPPRQTAVCQRIRSDFPPRCPERDAPGRPPAIARSFPPAPANGAELEFQAKRGDGGGAWQFKAGVSAARDIPGFEKIKLRERCLAA